MESSSLKKTEKGQGEQEKVCLMVQGWGKGRSWCSLDKFCVPLFVVEEAFSLYKISPEMKPSFIPMRVAEKVQGNEDGYGLFVQSPKPTLSKIVFIYGRYCLLERL